MEDGALAPTTVLVLPNFSVPRSAFSFSCSSSGRFFSSSFRRETTFRFGLWTLDFGLLRFSRAIGNRLAHDVADLRDLVNAHERVHLGHELGQFVAETLRQAAGNDDGLAALVGVAQFDGFEDGVHALLLRGINEGAGVDDDGVGLRGVIGDLDAALEQRAEHDLGVHEIFGAAERNHADAQRRLFIGIFLRHSRRRLAEFYCEAILRQRLAGTLAPPDQAQLKIISRRRGRNGIGRGGIGGNIFHSIRRGAVGLEQAAGRPSLVTSSARAA